MKTPPAYLLPTTMQRANPGAGRYIARARYAKSESARGQKEVNVRRIRENE